MPRRLIAGSRTRAAALLCAAAFVFLNIAGNAAASGWPTLVGAVKGGDRRAVDVLLASQRLDVNQAEPDGTTALHWAAHHGDLVLVRRLIRARANVGAMNRYGIAPIWLAAETGAADVVEALLEAGAD